MVNYENMPDEGGFSRRCGWVATAIYVVVIGLSMWLVQCESRSEVVEDASSGSLLVSFGEVAESSGERQKSPAEAATPEVKQPKVEEVTQPTDERSEVETPIEESPESPKPQEAQPTPTPSEDVVETKPREVNKRALFPGSSTERSDESQGAKQESATEGAAGSDRGNPEHDTTLGEGLSGNYSLTGRSLIGALPIPSYTIQAEGRVVIAITVDARGKVTSASLQLESTTTSNSRLISAARDAALKARFDLSEEFFQNGTITYIFKMN